MLEDSGANNIYSIMSGNTVIPPQRRNSFSPIPNREF
jgi:hypothetical protein